MYRRKLGVRPAILRFNQSERGCVDLLENRKIEGLPPLGACFL